MLFFLLCSPSKADPEIIEHTIADDGWVEVPLDFTLPFWGNSYTTSFMFSNGVVGFISPNDIPGTGIVNDGCAAVELTLRMLLILVCLVKVMVEFVLTLR